MKKTRKEIANESFKDHNIERVINLLISCYSQVEADKFPIICDAL